MPTLLLAGLHLAGSGLTNVMAGLARELGRRFDIDLVGFAPGESGIRTALAEGRRVEVLGTPARFYAAPRGWIERSLEQPPDAILVSGPGFMALPFLQQLQRLRGCSRIALYLPVEGELSGDTLGETFGLVDDCFLYCRDALRGAEALCGRMESRDPDFRPPRLAAIGHGFDREVFRPVETPGGERERRRAARAELFPGRPDLADAFIVLNANRIATRKRFDLTLAAFAAFARGKSDVRLCLHTGRRSTHQSEALEVQIAAAGLAGLVLLSPARDGELLAPARLNLLYNACDVGLTTSSGEGWGLGTFEHAATRAAQIVPDHTSFRENWAGAALLAETAESEFVFFESTLMHAVRPAAVATALERLYADPGLRAELAVAAHRRALAPRFSWAVVGDRIAGLLHPEPPMGRPSSPHPRQGEASWRL